MNHKRSKIDGILLEIRRARSGKIRKIRSLLALGVLRLFGPYVANKNVIYVWNPTDKDIAQPVDIPHDFKVICCKAIDDVPAQFWPSPGNNSNRVRQDFKDGFSQRHVLWIGSLLGESICFLWSARGRDLKQWYISLQPNDVVIYRVFTRLGFRGAGFARLLTRHVIVAERGEHDDIYLDTKQWNLAARQSFEKAGFRRLVVKPPLSPEKFRNNFQ